MVTPIDRPRFPPKSMHQRDCRWFEELCIVIGMSILGILAILIQAVVFK